MGIERFAAIRTGEDLLYFLHRFRWCRKTVLTGHTCHRRTSSSHVLIHEELMVRPSRLRIRRLHMEPESILQRRQNRYDAILLLDEIINEERRLLHSRGKVFLFFFVSDLSLGFFLAEKRFLTLERQRNSIESLSPIGHI